MKWVSFIPAPYRRTVIRAAQLDNEPVYLSGETGSGKSAIARWIHQNSPRSTKPLVFYRSGDSLLSRIAEAEDGTLVLLDVDGASKDERAILARLMRTRSHTDPNHPEVRVIMRARTIATGERPLDEFSPFEPVFKDFRVHLPSLQERRKEFGDIVMSLLEEMAHELRKDHVRSLSPEAMLLLRDHEWRANLRELRNVLRFAILSTKTGTIDADHLPDLRDPSGYLIRDRQAFAEIERSLPQH